MDPLLRLSITNTIGAAAIALLALVSALLLRRPALTHFLWLLVLVKLLTPPAFSIPIHLRAATQHVAPHPVALFEPAVQDKRPGQFSRDSGAEFGTATSMPAAQPHRTFWQRVEAVDFTRIFFATWIFGSIFCVAIAAIRLRRFHRILSFADPAPPDVIERVASLACKLGIRRPPATLFISAPVSPMLLGGFSRPRLLIPRRLWEHLDDRQREALLLHELAHMRRLDHLVRGVELLATVLYWWNPLTWLARRQLRIAEELCCDAWVTHALPAARDDYAAALVEAIDFASASRPALPLLASGVGEFKHLQRRLLMIRNGTTNRKMGWTALIGCAALVAVPLSLTRAQDAGKTLPPQTQPAEKPAANEKQADDKLQKALDRRVPDLNFEGVALADVLDFVRDVSGINIYVNWKELAAADIDKNTPITLRLRNVETSTALRQILAQADAKTRLRYKVENNVVQIGLAETAAPPAWDLTNIKVKDKQMQAQLDRVMPELNFQGVSLSDVVDFMRDVSGANIVPNWKSLEAAGIDRNSPVTLRVRNIHFSKALSLVFQEAAGGPDKLLFEVNGGVINILGAPAAPPATEKLHEVKPAPDAAPINSPR